MTALATLIVDAFDSSTINSTRWPTITTNTGGAVVVSNGQVELRHNWDADSGGWPPFFTQIASALGEIGSGCYWRFKPMLVNDAGVGHSNRVSILSGIVRLSNDEGFGFRQETTTQGTDSTHPGRLFCEIWNDIGDEWRVDVGEITNYAPDGAHAWLRCRYASNTFYWDTAPDDGTGKPGTWTQRFSYSTTGSGVSFDSMSSFLGTGGAQIMFRALHWDNVFDQDYVVRQPAFDGVNGPLVGTVNLTSVADPATYTTVPAGNTQGSFQWVSHALPASYQLNPVDTGQSFGQFSVALPANYSMTPAPSGDVKALFSDAQPASYTLTPQPTVSGQGFFSNAEPAAYAMVPGESTARVEDHHISIATPATYTMNGEPVDTVMHLTSWAIPAAYLTSGGVTTDETDGVVEEVEYESPPPRNIVTDLEFQRWLRDEKAIRVILVETQCIDENGNTQQFYVASRGFVTKLEDGENPHYYAPLMRGGLDFEQTIDIELEGERSFGDIQLDNTEGDLDWMFERFWQYQPCKAFVGDARWPRRDFRQIFDGSLEDIDSVARDTVNMRIRDKLHRLDIPLHEDKVGGTGPESDRLQPVAFGECHNVTPVLVDPTQLRYIYHAGVAEAVFEVRDNGVPVQRSSNSGPPSSFTLTKQPYGRITCSVQGDVRRAGQVNQQDPTWGYVNTVAELVLKIVKNWGTEQGKRFSDVDIDLDNFTQFSLNNRQPVGLYVTERMTVLEACQQIAAAVGARLTMTALGKLQLVKVEVPPIGSPIEVGESDMVSGSLHISDRAALVSGVKLGYCRNWTVQEDTAAGVPEEHKAMYAREWYTTSMVNPQTRDTYNLWGEPEQENCLLLREDDATTEATRRLRLRSVQRHVYEFTGFADLMFTPVGAAMKITHRRFGLSNGKIGQVVSVAVNWLTSQVTIRVLI